MALRDLLVRFGIEVEGKKKIDEVDNSLKATLRNANAFGRSLKQIGTYLLVGTIVRGVKDFIVGQMQQADALKHNAERLGVTTDEMQKYEYVSGIVGVSAQQTAVGFRFLDRAVGEAALGTKSATKVFGQLGVDIYEQGTKNIKPTSEIIMELSDAFKRTPSQAIRVALAMRTLGRGGSSLLPMLQKGSVELKQMFDDVDMLGGGFNDTFVEAAHDADVSIRRLKMGWRSIFVAVASEVLPVFKKWVDQSIRNVKVMIDFAKHTYGVRSALVALTSGTVIFALMRLAKVLGLGKFTVMDFFKALMRNAPLMLFVAAVTALYLAFDDLYTFIKGGDSIIGRFMDQIGGAGTALRFWKELKSELERVKVILSPLGGTFKDLAFQLTRFMVDSLPDIIYWGTTFTLMVVGALDGAVTGIRELLTLWGGFNDAVESTSMAPLNEAFDKVGKLSDAWGKRMDLYHGVSDTVGRMSQPAEALAVDGGSFSLPEQQVRAGSGTREPTQIKINQNIVINGDKGTTPAEIGKATSKGVKDGLAEHRDTYDAVGAGMPAGSAM